MGIYKEGGRITCKEINEKKTIRKKKVHFQEKITKREKGFSKM